MRRKTTALTRTIAGSALVASAAIVIPVWAQQNPPLESTSGPAQTAAATGAVPSPSATPSAPAVAIDEKAAAQVQANTVYGIGVSRGARYLVRNGLDYIEYQEYDRALKYLREAESRQAELTSAERLMLKQGIEKAQRGLREAVGARAPYAASKRRRPGGFTIAQGAKQARARELAAKAAADAGKNIEIDTETLPEPQGDPIQLTSGSTADRDGSNVIRAEAKPRDLQPQPQPQPPSAVPSDVAAEVTAAAAAALSSGASEGSAPAQLPDITDLTAPAMAASPSPGAGEKPALADLPRPPAVDPSVHPAADAPVPITLETIGGDPSPAPAVPTLPAAAASAPTVDEPAATPEPEPVAKEIETPLPPPQSQPPAQPETASAAAAAAESMPDDDGLPPVPPTVAKADAETTPTSNADLTADDDFPPLPADISQGAAPVPVSEPVPVIASAAEAEERSAPIPVPIPVPAPEAESAVSDEERLPPLPAEAEVLPESPTGNPPAIAAVPTPDPAETPSIPADEAAPPAEPASSRAPSEPSEAMPLLSGGGVASELAIPQRANPTSRLTEQQAREVEQVARQQEELLRRRQNAPPGPGSRSTSPEDSIVPDLGGGSFRADPNEYGNQSQVDISRAPSPAEARPIHAIPVPDDYVPLAPRDWSPQRKYWSAAATCHMPLYFQDAALERYGHSAEQFLGPTGRFFSYPLDDPTQSTQRNQILQPFFSVGLFAAQIVALPYNLIVDPPWEAEYDLGYYRPGDRIPTDIYYLPLHGVGPPLKGKNY